MQYQTEVAAGIMSVWLKTKAIESPLIELLVHELIP